MDGPFIDGLPINSMVIFHGYVTNNQMVILIEGKVCFWKASTEIIAVYGENEYGQKSCNMATCWNFLGSEDTKKWHAEIQMRKKEFHTVAVHVGFCAQPQTQKSHMMLAFKHVQWRAT